MRREHREARTRERMQQPLARRDGRDREGRTRGGGRSARAARRTEERTRASRRARARRATDAATRARRARPPRVSFSRGLRRVLGGEDAPDAAIQDLRQGRGRARRRDAHGRRRGRARQARDGVSKHDRFTLRATWSAARARPPHPTPRTPILEPARNGPIRVQLDFASLRGSAVCDSGIRCRSTDRSGVQWSVERFFWSQSPSPLYRTLR